MPLEGTDKVKVRMSAFKEGPPKPTPFRVEIEVGGELLFHQGVISPNGETKLASDIELLRSVLWRMRPHGRKSKQLDTRPISDEVVLAQWGTVLPDGHIIRVGDSAAITDVLIGALAIANGRDTSPGYLEKLKDDGADRGRMLEVERALKALPF